MYGEGMGGLWPCGKGQAGEAPRGATLHRALNQMTDLPGFKSCLASFTVWGSRF